VAMEASLSLELEEESMIIPHIHKRGCGMLCAILRNTWSKAFVLVTPARKSIRFYRGKILKDQLRRCIGCLLDIIHDNGLHVEACEKNIKCEDMGFNPNITITGYLDMRLADDKDRQYVFDFKWTTSKRYEYALEENRSLQLALYSELVRRQLKKNVVAEAYFHMPRGKLYSTFPFAASDHFEQLALAEDAPKDKTIDLVRNSYAYRRRQITEGEIEMGEVQPLELLPYGQDMEECHLLPLACDDGKNKRPNYYSNNGFLKQ
jgi:hypothetical protein